MSKKIVDLNGLDNLAKALDSRAKTAINNEKVRAEAKEAELEQSINDTVAMFGGKSIRYVTQAQYDQLSEAEQNSNTVIYFITDAVDLSHTHANADILNNIKEVQVTIGDANQAFDGSENISFTLSEIGAAEKKHTHDQYITMASLNGYATKTDLQTGLDAKANEKHFHSEYYDKDTVNSLLNEKSDDDHNHDDVYYKKSETYDKEEVNGLVGKKADSASLTSLKTTLEGKISTAQTNAVSAASTDASNKDAALKTELTSTITTELAGKSDTGHTHNDVYYTEDEVDELLGDYYKKANTYNKTEVDGFLGGKAPSSHTHDDIYFTETEVTKKLAGKSDTGHKHEDDYYNKTAMDAKIQTLKTTDIANAKSDAISEAKGYADQKISALVGSAPEAMNTLQELAKAISDHQAVYDAYVKTVSGDIADAKQEAINTANTNAASKDTALHTTISKEIDDDIAAAKLALQANIDKKSNEGHTHNYAGSSSAGGAATSANKVNTNLVVKLNSGTTEGTNLFTFNGSAAKTLNITPANIGAAASSHGIHVDYATAAPKIAGTAAVGTSEKVAREDHVHPVQTSVSGNAGSATKLATGRTFTIGKTGKSFDGSKDVSWTLAEIGALPTAGGTMAGNINYQFSGTGGHAVGLSWKNNNADKTVFGGVGALANAGVGSILYMGWGDSPWVAANNFNVSSSGIKYKNNKIYHAGDKPTPADIGAAPASKSVVTKTASSNAITLSKDQYQVASGLTNGGTINLPNVSGTTIVEINLFVNNVSLSTLKLPDNCVWRVDPNLEVGKYFMFTFLWNGTIWLAEAKIYS